jgi:ankyrin repeat protein
MTRFHLIPLAALLLVGCNTHAAVPTLADARGTARDEAHGALHRQAEDCQTDALRATLMTPAYRGLTAEIDRPDRTGMTPLALAARAGCLPAVISLEQAGADVDIVDAATGWTPLHYAASQRHAAVVDFLLAHGAQQDRKTRLGESPLALALLGTQTRFGLGGNQHTTEMVLSSGRSRAKYDPKPRVATSAKKPAAKKSTAKKSTAINATGSKPAAKKSAAN